MEKTKKCAKCKKQLPTKDFPKDNSAKDKLWRFCRKCESARKKAYREANKSQTKPTNTKSKKESAKKSALKIYFRLKCSMKSNVPGQFTYHFGQISREIRKQHISIYLPRIAECNYHSFDDLFSEVVSHEYIHYAILKNVGIEATTGLDNIFGCINEMSEVGIGLSR